VLKLVVSLYFALALNAYEPISFGARVVEPGVQRFYYADTITGASSDWHLFLELETTVPTVFGFLSSDLHPQRFFRLVTSAR
jgi:hypothetical protein